MVVSSYSDSNSNSTLTSSVSISSLGGDASKSSCTVGSNWDETGVLAALFSNIPDLMERQSNNSLKEDIMEVEGFSNITAKQFVDNFNDFKKFMKKFVDTRFLCEYLKGSIDSNKKCTIYEALNYFGTISNDKLNYLNEIGVMFFLN